MPDATIDAFIDHGSAARTIDADPAGAAQTLERIGEVGVDIDAVANRLEDEGVSAFIKSFDDLVATLTEKSHTF